MLRFSKTAQSTVRRPFNQKQILPTKKKWFTQKVNTAKAQAVNTARPKAVKTARPNSAVVNVVRVNQANAIKASACWVWRPTKPNSASITLKKHNYINARGISKYMTGNIAYLSDFKEFDGGYVTFGGGAHGGRISGKGTLKTNSLDFKDVYFVNELKFNLFSVSQMCDKKNYVLFTDTECLVLSPNFKLPDENQILLKIPRKDNMYSFDMKNIIPKESLTCLVAKATSDESCSAYGDLVEAVSIACYVQNRVLVVKPHNKTPYELFRGFKPALSFMRPFGCHVTILNTLDSLGKFDGKSDEGTITNESAGIQGELNAGTSTEKEEISQDCIVMPIWKDASYFDSPSKDVDNGEPKSAADDQKQVEDGPDNENDEKDKSFFNLTLLIIINTASSYDQDSPKDMFTMGASHTLEATHVEFFSDEDEPEVDLGNEELADYINTPNWNCPAFYEDDDEEYTIAITTVLPTEEPDNSLSMGDEHLSTIPKTELEELIKSNVENLVPIPSESKDFSDIEIECDVPVCDNFTTFSNPLFDADDDFSSSDDESFPDEDIPKEIYSNPLFDEEIISTKIDPHHFNAES
ncbi:ribonuclease H-like domain-containing protein [Tanacetum coccineum]